MWLPDHYPFPRFGVKDIPVGSEFSALDCGLHGNTATVIDSGESRLVGHFARAEEFAVGVAYLGEHLAGLPVVALTADTDLGTGEEEKEGNKKRKAIQYGAPLQAEGRAIC